MSDRIRDLEAALTEIRDGYKSGLTSGDLSRIASRALLASPPVEEPAAAAEEGKAVENPCVSCNESFDSCAFGVYLRCCDTCSHGRAPVPPPSPVSTPSVPIFHAMECQREYGSDIGCEACYRDGYRKRPMNTAGTKECPTCGGTGDCFDDEQNRRDCGQCDGTSIIPSPPASPVGDGERERLRTAVIQAAANVPVSCLQSHDCPNPEIAEVWRAALRDLLGAIAGLCLFEGTGRPHPAIAERERLRDALMEAAKEMASRFCDADAVPYRHSRNEVVRIACQLSALDAREASGETEEDRDIDKSMARHFARAAKQIETATARREHSNGCAVNRRAIDEANMEFGGPGAYKCDCEASGETQKENGR